MKIKINEFETYEFAMGNDAVFYPEQFRELMARLQNILKIIGKDPLEDIAKTTPQLVQKKYVKRGEMTRERVVKLISAYYNPDKNVGDVIFAQEGRTRASVSTIIKPMREKFAIKPEEVGIKEFRQYKQD